MALMICCLAGAALLVAAGVAYGLVRLAMA
jgi:hypothetical protein